MVVEFLKTKFDLKKSKIKKQRKGTEENFQKLLYKWSKVDCSDSLANSI